MAWLLNILDAKREMVKVFGIAVRKFFEKLSVLEKSFKQLNI